MSLHQTYIPSLSQLSDYTSGDETRGSGSNSEPVEAGAFSSPSPIATQSRKKATTPADGPSQQSDQSQDLTPRWITELR